MTESSYLHVSVVSIGRIDVQVPDRVEKTKSIEAIVRLFDSMDNLLVLDHSNLEIYELHEDVFNANILSVKLDHQFNLNVGEIRYLSFLHAVQLECVMRMFFFCRYQVTGLELGETKAVFYAGYNDHLIKSSTVTIQVSDSVFFYINDGSGFSLR